MTPREWIVEFVRALHPEPFVFAPEDEAVGRDWVETEVDAPREDSATTQAEVLVALAKVGPPPPGTLLPDRLLAAQAGA